MTSLLMTARLSQHDHCYLHQQPTLNSCHALLANPPHRLTFWRQTWASNNEYYIAFRVTLFLYLRLLQVGLMMLDGLSSG